jgi:hypothetical protein
MLTTSGAIVNENVARSYFASTLACGSCRLQQQCCPNTLARKILCSIYEHARVSAGGEYSLIVGTENSLVGAPP